MNAMKHYFNYNVQTMCGISKVKLLGSLEDWKKLREATHNLGKYGLQWWTNNLDEILQKFINTYEGEADVNFWKFIYKYYRGGSGTKPTVDGWILNFIPYIKGK